MQHRVVIKIYLKKLAGCVAQPFELHKALFVKIFDFVYQVIIDQEMIDVLLYLLHFDFYVNCVLVDWREDIEKCPKINHFNKEDILIIVHTVDVKNRLAWLGGVAVDFLLEIQSHHIQGILVVLDKSFVSFVFLKDFAKLRFAVNKHYNN